MTVTVVSNSRIDVAWTAVLGAASYRVYRNGVLTDSPTTEAASATGLAGSTQYLFAVSCIDATGQEGPQSQTFPGTTFANPDTTAPTAPGISAGGATLSSVVVSLVTPAIDTGSGVASYTLQRATNAAFTAGLVTTDGVTFPVTVQNLASSTQYFFRARAVDAAGNIGAFGATVSITTQAAQVAQSLWANWPTMSICMAQGAIADNLGDSAMWDLIADHDVHAFQWAFPTISRLTNRCNWIDGVLALQSGTAMRTWFFMYVNMNQTIKDQAATDTPWAITRDFVQSSTEGNSNWYLRRATPNQAQVLEPNFDPTNNRKCNVARGGGLNSLGEFYGKTFCRKHRAPLATGTPSTDLDSRLMGWFFDNVDQRVPNVFTNNGGTSITDYDMNGDGLADSRSDYSATGGSGASALGLLDTKAEFEAQNPGKVAFLNTANYDGDVINGNASPPMPFSVQPHYQKFEFQLAESQHLSLGFAKTATGYQVTPGSISRLYRGLEIQKQYLKPDPNPLTVQGCVVLHTNTVDRVTLNQDDYEYARFHFVLSLLIERCGHSVTSGTSRPVPIDERNAYLGNPRSSRSMGTLNTSTGTFSLRSPDFTNGSAQFWWAEYDEAIVVMRGDYPPGPYPAVPYPSAQAAVACTLPSPGAGKKWQRFNGGTYVNPVTQRRMRGISPLVNDGSDVGSSVSLKQLHGIVLRRVNV